MRTVQMLTQTSLDYGALVGVIMVLLAVAGVVKTLWDFRHAPVKTVKARVVDKSRYEIFSKYSGTGKAIQHVIIFEIEGKKRSFNVSEFSYGGYHIGERGTLKYKGKRIVDFS